MPTDKQRREAERRRAQRQLQRRAERDAARRRTTLIISVVGVVIVVGLVIGLIAATTGDDSTPKAGASGPSTSATVPTPTPASSAPARTATYPCTWTKSGAAARKVTVPASTTPPKSGKVTISVATNRGAMTFSLNRALAPCTVDSFASLVAQRYYDRTPCHRLTTSGIYVLQCGDPLGTGGGGPGYTIPDEATGTETYPAGTIAMARTAEAHSGGSQFFIVYKDSPNLRQNLGQLQYTVFGTVSKGLPVVQQVAAAGVSGGGADGKPKLAVTLTALTAGK